jgi:predicted TIM-barrel fold metal-dependent hydrolase
VRSNAPSVEHAADARVIIDAHTHVFPPRLREARETLVATEPAFAEIYGDVSAAMATAEDILASMDQARVDRSIVCNFAWHDDALIDESNEYLINAARSSGGRLIPFVSLSFAGAGKHGGPDTEEAVGAMKKDARTAIRVLASAGARGIGELRPAHSGFDLGNSDEADLLAWASAAFDLPLLVHASEPVGHSYPGKTGTPIEQIYRFASQSAAVTVIAAHWGGGLPFYGLMPEVRDALANVYVDTAAGHLLYDPAIYRHVIDIVGLEKVLWASDFPLTTQAKALERTRAAGLSDTELAAVLGGNIARLLGL